jgi:ABC-type multidrug transport system fused ATPase/permease subunit
VSSLTEQKEMITRYGFSSFFARFEYGLFTRIGEDGRLLSGGEKQIVGLARALYDNPDILIIDEGITALDREVETLIFRILSKYAQNHAVLISTHALRIILKTDYLYVVKNGSIIQEGDPHHLLKSEGYFNSVFRGKNSHLDKLKIVS